MIHIEQVAKPIKERVHCDTCGSIVWKHNIALHRRTRKCQAVKYLLYARFEVDGKPSEIQDPSEAPHPRFCLNSISRQMSQALIAASLAGAWPSRHAVVVWQGRGQAG